MHRTRLTVGDIILMSATLFIAALLFILPFFTDGARTAQIVLAETGEVRSVSLGQDADYQISSRGVSLTVTVSGGEIFVSHSDCRDGICKSTPPISRAGQSIVCAPAGVVLRIDGEEAIVDGVSQ